MAETIQCQLRPSLPPIILLTGEWTVPAVGMGAMEMRNISNPCRKLNTETSFVLPHNLVTVPTKLSNKLYNIVEIRRRFDAKYVAKFLPDYTGSHPGRHS
jgi:hypothetical protein